MHLSRLAGRGGSGRSAPAHRPARPTSARAPTRRHPPLPTAAGGNGYSAAEDAYDPFADPPPTRPPAPPLQASAGRLLGPDPDVDPYWAPQPSAADSVEDDGVLAEASRGPPHHHHRGSAAAASTAAAPAPTAGPVSPLVPDAADLAAAPGTQAARLRDLQAAAAARRDVHWAMYRAHSAKANLLATAVLLTTTAGGTSGLVSLVGGGGGGSAAPIAGPPGWTYTPPPGGGPWAGVPAPPSFSTAPAGSGASAFSSQAAPALGPGAGFIPPPPPPPPSPSTAALLTPILGFASTIFSGFQSYAKPSTAASRHLTAFKRYQLLARHARDALAYGRAATLGRVIQAVERKIDQYCDESPVIGLGDPIEGAGGSGAGGGQGAGVHYQPSPGAWRAFWMALTELPE